MLGHLNKAYLQKKVENKRLALGDLGGGLAMIDAAEARVELDWYALTEGELHRFDKEGYLTTDPAHRETSSNSRGDE